MRLCPPDDTDGSNLGPWRIDYYSTPPAKQGASWGDNASSLRAKHDQNTSMHFQSLVRKVSAFIADMFILFYFILFILYSTRKVPLS